MTTLYFSAPIMVTLLAALILKERASRGQWIRSEEHTSELQSRCEI